MRILAQELGCTWSATPKNEPIVLLPNQLKSVQIPFIFGSSPIGVLFSGVVLMIAALNSILDFDFIEQGALRGAPQIHGVAAVKLRDRR